MYSDKECPECGSLCFPVGNELNTAKVDYEEVLADHRRLVRELDVLINGEEGAAKQASLADIVAQVKRQGLVSKQPATPAPNLLGPFVFEAPSWTNSGRPPANPAEALQRAREMSLAYYALGAQSGIHSMIEWCGVMGEYCRMLEVAQATGIDPCEVDQHHTDCKVAIPEFMATYFVEKLGCQLKPFIRADRSMWRKLLEDWFEGEGQHIVCEFICQKPAASLHATEEDAMKHAVACAMENLYDAEDPEDPEDRKESEERLYDMLTEFDAICEGDYEVHMLLPTNRAR